MLAPKGWSKLAYGPCCNPTCAFAIDIQCKCGCGHERDPASVPTHHLFHPDCCTQEPNDPNLLGTEADRPAFPSKEALLSACALGADMSASHRWWTVPEELQDKRFGLQLLPAKAVLCPTCYALLWSWQERDNYDKMRERAEGIVRGHLGELPDYVISALCAVVILRFWLRGASRRAVWQASGFRVHRTMGGATRLDTFVVPLGGGDVFKGGLARAMAVVGTLLVLYTVQLCGSGQTTTDQRNTLGCAAVVTILNEYFGPVFWAAVGRHVHDAIVAAVPERLKRIRQRSLTELTPWSDDERTLPRCLTWLVKYIYAGEKELLPGKDLSAEGAEQKWRMCYLGSGARSCMSSCRHGRWCMETDRAKWWRW